MTSVAVETIRLEMKSYSSTNEASAASVNMVAVDFQDDIVNAMADRVIEELNISSGNCDKYDLQSKVARASADSNHFCGPHSIVGRGGQNCG